MEKKMEKKKEKMGGGKRGGGSLNFKYGHFCVLDIEYSLMIIGGFNQAVEITIMCSVL